MYIENEFDFIDDLFTFDCETNQVCIKKRGAMIYPDIAGYREEDIFIPYRKDDIFTVLVLGYDTRLNWEVNRDYSCRDGVKIVYTTEYNERKIVFEIPIYNSIYSIFVVGNNTIGGLLKIQNYIFRELRRVLNEYQG